MLWNITGVAVDQADLLRCFIKYNLKLSIDQFNFQFSLANIRYQTSWTPLEVEYKLRHVTNCPFNIRWGQMNATNGPQTQASK